ncbi:MAG: type II toxin-antitoxin system RelE/ParE family toxin [Acidimicrobiia bacterium]
MTEPIYEIVVAAPAARVIRETLPEAVAFAVIDFITGPLRENPRRVGAALRNELGGIWSARRGTYRILYRIDVRRREVIVLRVGHRRDIYRTR